MCRETAVSLRSVSEAVSVLLDDKLEPELRAEAANALSELGQIDDNALSALIQALQYKGPAKPNLSEAATAASLACYDTPKLIKRLRSRWRWRGALNEIADDYFKRRSHWQEVFSVDPMDPTPESARLTEFYSNSVRAISAREDAVTLAEELEAELRWDWACIESFRVRTTAAKALGEIGDGRAVKPLVAALDDEDDVVRHTAAEALGKIGDKSAIGPLKRAMHLRRFDFWNPPSFGKFAHLFPPQGRRHQ